MSCGKTSFCDYVELITSGIYGLVTILLYIYLIVVILRTAQFRHPFFYQFIILSISNIILFLSMFVMQRLVPHKGFCNAFFPLVANGPFFFRPIIYCYHMPIVTQLVTVSTISINRMSVVLSPIKATHFWANHCTHTNIGILLVSALGSFYVYGWNSAIEASGSSTNKSLSVNLIQGWPNVPLTFMGALYSLFCIIVIFISAVVALFYLCRSNITKVRNAETNLFWTSLIFSCTTGALSFYMVMLYVFVYISPDRDFTVVTVTIRGWLYDVNCLVPAWLLVLTNKQIRQILWGKKAVIHISAVSHSQASQSRISQA